MRRLVQELFDADGKTTVTAAGGMPDRVGKRWGDTTHHDLPQPLHAGPVEHGVRLVDEVDGDLGETAGSTTIRLTQTVTITAADGKPIATKRTLTLRKARKK